MALNEEKMPLNTDGITEARLMRSCGDLYVSISIESFVTTCMGLVFTWLLLLITNKGRLEKPGKALLQFIRSNVRSFLRALFDEYSLWPSMKERNLDERFALCRKMNQAVCLLQIVLCFLTVERWLHIHNVNGFRYFGYSLTCPPMQTQLLILIAPVIPCYRFLCVVTFAVTMVMLWLGYAASLLDSTLYNGDLVLFMQSGDLRDLQPTLKFWFSAAAFVVLCYLNLVQIPWLYFLYKWNGGKKNGLPPSYGGILAIVSFSWFAFPAWWLLSYEGMAIITDTKMSAAIFALLNIASKAGFTLQMLHMVRLHRTAKKVKEAQEAKAERLMQRQVSPDSVSTVGLFDPHEDDHKENKIRKTDTWVVRMLRPYDSSNDAPESWLILEEPFRTYLQLEGMTPDVWAHLDVQAKLEHRKAYTQEYEEAAKMRESDVQTNGTAGKCYSSEGRGAQLPKYNSSEGRGAQQSQPYSSEDSPGGQSLTPADCAQISRLEAAVEEALEDTLEVSRPGPKIGQVVSVVDGRTGVVTGCLGGKVKLKIEETIDISDLTHYRVIILGALGLLSNDDVNLNINMELRCSCLVQGLPESEVETDAAQVEGLKATWNHEVEMFGFCSGRPLVFRVWGSSRGEETLLGEASLLPELLTERGFRGQLYLDSGRAPQAEEVGARLDVAVEIVNLPEEGRRISKGPEEVRRSSHRSQPSNRCLYDSIAVMLGLPSKGCPPSASACLPRRQPAQAV